LILDTEAVEDTAVSLSFDVEVTDAFGSYVCLLHQDITIRTGSFAHGSVSCFAHHTQKGLAAVSLAEMLLSASPFVKHMLWLCMQHSTSINLELWFAWMGLTVLVGFGVAVLAATGE
jgi:hypothetical protein